MGVWIAVAIVLFALGSIMALKPSGVDVRLDKLRMTARRLELNPKLVACPDWVRGKSGDYGSGMIGQYALILADKKLPETRYSVIDGILRSDTSASNCTNNEGKAVFYAKLDNTDMQLPESIAPFVKAVYSKANSMVIYWDDSAYVKPASNPNYSPEAIEPDLNKLKQQLANWAEILS